MSKREFREKRRREREERQYSTLALSFETGGWLEDESTRKNTNGCDFTTFEYTYPAPTYYVSDADRIEQEWNGTQNRMHPTPAPVKRFHPEAYTLLKPKIPEEKLHFSRYMKKENSFVNDVAITNYDCAFVSTIPDSQVSNAKIVETDAIKIDVNAISLEHVYDDLQNHWPRKQIHVGLAAFERIVGKHRRFAQPRKESFLHRATSYKSDPLAEYMVYVPDKGNFKEEEEHLEEIQRECKQTYMTEFIKIRGSRSNYIILLYNGLQAQLEILQRKKFCHRRVLCHNPFEREIGDIRNEIIKKYNTLIGIRRLGFPECNFINDRCFTIKKFIKQDRAFELLFGNKDEAERLIFENSTKPRNFFNSYPSKADRDLLLLQDETVGMYLTWYPYPSLLTAEICVEDPKDVGFTCWILFSHGFQANCGGINKYNPTNKRIELTMTANDPMSYDTDAFEYAMKKILDGNGIKYESLTLLRSNEQPICDNDIENRIHLRIGRAAVCAGLWDSDRIPGRETDWFKFVARYKNTLPWTVDLYNTSVVKDRREKAASQDLNRTFTESEDALSDQKDDSNSKRKMRIATVLFNDEAYGRGIIDYLLPISPRCDTFSFSYKDKLGVRFDPFYRVRRHVPHFIRSVIDNFLSTYDREIRIKSDMQRRRWCRFIDDISAEQIIVEGWPINDVNSAVRKLDEQLKGFSMDCSDPETTGNLLHGIGLNFLNILQNHLREEVVISINRFEKSLIIIGDEKKRENAVQKLLAFSNNRDAYIIKAKISLEGPRFLPSLQNYIVNKFCLDPDRNTVQMKPSILGCSGELKILCSYGQRYIEFRGTVGEFERLQKALDTLQKEMLHYFKAAMPEEKLQNLQFRTLTCPICLNDVSYSNYRLYICGHIYCLDCLSNMVLHSIQNKQFPIRCLHYKEEVGLECNECVALADIMYLIYDKNFAKYPHFFKERLDLLTNSITGMIIQNNQNLYRHCARPGCNGVFCRSLMSRREGFTKCDVCGYKVCNKCLYPPHPDNSCEIEAAVRESADKSINYFLSTNIGKVQRCPNNCGAVIEKGPGCNHIHCQFCKIHFCWICQFKAGTESEIYAHMGEVHNGTGGGWEFLDNLRPGQPIPMHLMPPDLLVEEEVEAQQGGPGQDGFPEWVMINGNRVEM